MKYELGIVGTLFIGFIAAGLVFGWGLAFLILIVLIIIVVLTYFAMDYYFNKIKLNKDRRQYDKEKDESRAGEFPARPAHLGFGSIERAELPTTIRTVGEESGTSEYPSDIIPGTDKTATGKSKRRYKPITW